MGIEPGELFKLHRGTAHYETVAIICVSFHRRFFPQRSVSVMIFEDRLICEREGIAVETKVRLHSPCRCRIDRDRAERRNNTRQFPPRPKHHIKSELRR